MDRCLLSESNQGLIIIHHFIVAVAKTVRRKPIFSHSHLEAAFFQAKKYDGLIILRVGSFFKNFI